MIMATLISLNEDDFLNNIYSLFIMSLSVLSHGGGTPLESKATCLKCQV